MVNEGEGSLALSGDEMRDAGPVDIAMLSVIGAAVFIVDAPMLVAGWGRRRLDGWLSALVGL